MLRNIAELQAKKARMEDQVTQWGRDLDTQTLRQAELEAEERDKKEDILKLKEHSEVVKAQNQQMYLELEELSRADDYVREKLMRFDVVNKLKERNAHELARSTINVDRSRSPERQREIAFGPQYQQTHETLERSRHERLN